MANAIHRHMCKKYVHMGTHMAKKKKEQKPDPRPNRRAVSAIFDADNSDDASVIDYMVSVKKGGGVWKRTLGDALLLYRAFQTGDMQVITKVLPELARAIRLFNSLSKGEHEVLFEMFPVQAQKFRAQIETELVENMHDETRHHVIEGMYRVQEKLDGLEAIRRGIERLQAMGVSAPQAPKSVGLKPVMAQGDGGIRQIGTGTLPQFDVPDDEDFDPSLFQIKKDDTAGERSANNLINSLTKIQAHKGDVDPEIQQRIQRRAKKHDTPDSELFKVEKAGE